VALKYYSSVRLDIRRIESIKVGKEIIGNRARVRVVKNKVAPPFRVAEFEITHDEGISKVADLLEIGVETAIIRMRGSSYGYGDTSLGQGRQAAKAFLRQHADVAEEIEQMIRQQVGLPPLAAQEPIELEDAD
ncbi:MAG: DNA recombination/repair protein RecA, partial [Anaerolineales bacterium]